jgi:hypothetical protein
MDKIMEENNFLSKFFFFSIHVINFFLTTNQHSSLNKRFIVIKKYLQKL